MILCLGELIAFWLNYGCAQLASDDWWRIPLAIQIVPAAALGVGCWFRVPPSPRWLVDQGRQECAREVLTRLHGRAEADRELRAIAETVRVRKTRGREARWGDMFAMPVLRVTLLGVTVQFLQQITGTNRFVCSSRPVCFDARGRGGFLCADVLLVYCITPRPCSSAAGSNPLTRATWLPAPSGSSSSSPPGSPSSSSTGSGARRGSNSASWACAAP